MKVRFPDAFLVSHKIMQRHRMQKYICYCSWCTREDDSTVACCGRVNLKAYPNFSV